MRLLVLSLATLALLAVVGGSCAVAELEDALLIPADPAGSERVVVVEPGAALGAVVGQLAAADLFSRPAWVRFYAEHLRAGDTPVSGEYALSRDLSAVQQLERILEGAVVTYTVNLPPGVTAEEAFQRFAQAGVVSAHDLTPLLTDRAFLDEVGVSAESLEGYLFPDPYTLPKGLSPRALLKRLVERYREVVSLPELEADPNDALTEHQRLVLASLIQKSGVRPSEWRLFAALLRNRLRLGLPLNQAFAERYGRRFTPANEHNRWNTRRAGLPPTPICSPGIEAIAAVVHPARSDVRYMVARSNGTHVFCRDQDCYRAAIRQWKMGLPPVPPGVLLGPDGLPVPSPVGPTVDAEGSGSSPGGAVRENVRPVDAEGSGSGLGGAVRENVRPAPASPSVPAPKEREWGPVEEHFAPVEEDEGLEKEPDLPGLRDPVERDHPTPEIPPPLRWPRPPLERPRPDQRPRPDVSDSSEEVPAWRFPLEILDFRNL